MIETRQKLMDIVARMERSGDPEREFFYLGGAMSGIPKFNIPRFAEVAEILRNNTYNIITPTEIDDPEVKEFVENCEDGIHDGRVPVKYERLLARDAVIVSMPACIGGIFIPGWEKSNGAKLETIILWTLGKPVYEFKDDNGFGLPGLTVIPQPQIERTWVSSPGAVEIQEDPSIPRKINESIIYSLDDTDWEAPRWDNALPETRR